MAPREVLAEAAALYAGQDRGLIDLAPAGGVEVARRITAGEAADVVVLASDAIDSLVSSGHVLSEGCLPLMSSDIAIGVQTGAAHPHPTDAADVRDLVLNAPSLGYSTGPSGRYLERLFDRWGILEQVRSRVVIPPPGVPVARLIATGDVALGFQQLSELLNVSGVDVLAPLPASIQLRTVFTAGVCSACQAPLEADQFVRFAASEAIDAVIRRHGMTPIA